MLFNTQTETMPVQMRLPFDILLIIMEASPRCTTAKMMRTCHALRDAGAKLLFDGGVSLTTERRIISFVQFVRADQDSRFQRLRVLEISAGELPVWAADDLWWFITHPSLALDSLALREADSILKSHISPSEPNTGGDPYETLVIAFAQLRTIRHLTIGQCGQRASTLIRTICSPLKTISIDFPSDGRINEDEAESRNPIVLLANHAATLEEISGSNFAMRLQQVLYRAVFPSVRTIHATFDAALCPRTSAYTAAFPNLTHFCIAFVDHAPTPRWTEFPPATRELRRRFWNHRSLEGLAPMPVWTKLEEVEGTVLDVLALGLACQVHRVRLIGTILPRSPECQCVSLILDDTLPDCLAITIAGASTFGDTMGSLLRRPSAQQLRALEVKLIFSASEGDMYIHEVLVRVLTTLFP